MTAPSPSDPRPAPELAQIAPVATDDPAVIGNDPGVQDCIVVTVWSRKCGKAHRLGICHGRLGFGLGGGLS